MEKWSVILMLTAIGSIAIVTVRINNKTLDKNDESLLQEDEINSNVIDNQSAQYHENRVVRSSLELNLPSDHGYIKVYVRTSCRDDRRYHYQLIRFPYVRYDHRQFPTYGSWVRVSRWMLIYVERITRQTTIYASTGVYVMPALANYYGKLYSVAELIAYRYATFRHNGGSMPRYFNIAHYTIPATQYGRGMAKFNPQTGGYTESIHSNYRLYFRPNCPNEYNENRDDRQPYDNQPDEYTYKTNNYYKGRSRPSPTVKRMTTGIKTSASRASKLSTHSMTTPFMTMTGGSISYPESSPSTALPGRRRRRNFIESTQITSYMPIGGCLIIGLQKDDINAAQNLHKQNAFFKHLPLGVKVVPFVDGQQINLYTFMQENKLSKATYNQLVTQDHLVHGHHLTLGALGCLEAHVRAWERVVEVNRPMLIVEEDTHFDKELFDYTLPYLLYSLPTNFSLLYFGNIVGEDMQSKLLDYNDFLWKVNGSNWGTYAYLISPQAAATLLDFIYPVYAQVDSMIIDIAQSQSFDVYISKQILVKTDNTLHRMSHTQRYIIPPIIIPRILHFIWLANDSFSTASQRNLELWKKFHPNWQIQLWTNETIYNSNLNIYNKYRLEHSARSLRQVSDIIRYEILYQYGGIYVDVDFEPLKNIEPLLHGVEAFVVHENSHFICNGIYGATPAHELSKRLVLQLELNWKNYENGTVNQQTGPYHMTKQVEEMQKEQHTSMKNQFQIFVPHIFFPYAWYEKDPGHPYDPSAFAVHHFRSFAEIERNAIERS